MKERVINYLKLPDELKEQIMRPFQRFFRNEASSSILLLFATAVAFIWANSPLASTYHHFWEMELHLSLGTHVISRTLREWIDEGLMSIFFFTVGLEIKREILVGELASVRRAFLPVGAALGGMMAPAFIYYLFNQGLPTAAGWGIPMATDIAFALGVIYIMGKRVPLGIRILLSALAIADDLGAVFVIAMFYTKEIFLNYLFVSVLLILLIAMANYLWIRKTLVYAVLGILLWFAILASGVHATIAGIIVAMFIPARGKYDTDKFIQEVSAYLNEFECESQACGFSILLNEPHLNAVQSIEMACHHVETPLQRLEHALHPWVAYLVVPLFAFANVGVTIGEIDVVRALTSPLSLGIVLGLFIGKPLGITLFSYITVKVGLASLSKNISWKHIFGVGVLGGIGFTMSLFISGLSFVDKQILDHSRLAILSGSFISGVTGMLLLYKITGTGRVP